MRLQAAARLGQAAALDNPKKDEHDRENQQNVNEAAHRGRRDHSEQPQDDENESDCLKHGVVLMSRLLARGRAVCPLEDVRVCTMEQRAGRRVR